MDSLASACGKSFLCGEHAVVYGVPALAVPLPDLRAEAQVKSIIGPCRIMAPDLDLDLQVNPHDPDPHPLVTTVLSALGHFEQPLPDATITVSSQIPIGRGLGSGSAISAAIFRALAGFYGLEPAKAEELAFIHQIDTIYHGRPSGIDGAVVSHERALRFVRGEKPVFLDLPTGWSLLIADSGISSPTHLMVNGLRERYDQAPHRYDLLMTAIGALSRQVEIALKTDAMRIVGRLLNRNQALLNELGVSTPRIEELAQTARDAGALGAKLSGAGGGGVVIALTQGQPEQNQEILAAWQAKGVERSWSVDY